MRFIKLKVHPGSKKDEIVKKAEDSYHVWVRALPERGQANHAALALLASAIGEKQGRLRLVKGALSPAKIVAIPDYRIP
ncbi:MAG: DUF167 family protein [Elusimicrobiota bacterium]